MEYETVIGLEVHVQLLTRSKMFCSCRADYQSAAPNTRVCPVCLGLPGAMPVINRKAVEFTIMTGLALNCQIPDYSKFDRKNYPYPDLMKGYQITQFSEPLATEGMVSVRSDGETRPIRIRRIHLEEDAGKSIHDRVPDGTAVDLNRTGVPLIEIVTEPDLRTPAQARTFLQELKRTLEYLDVSDCNMEEGSLRVDANVSLRADGSDVYGVKTEVKNLNSFSAVERSVVAEAKRQAAILDAGGEIVQETLLWDERDGTLRSMRSKEESHDYRYFPDPDLPPLRFDAERIRRLEAELPELPAQRRTRLMEEHDLDGRDVDVLIASRSLADYFEALVTVVGEAKTAANWVKGPLLKEANRLQLPVDDLGILPADFGELIGLVEDGTVSGSMGRKVLGQMVDSGKTAREIIETEGLSQVQDSDELNAWVDAVIEENSEEVERYRSGETRLMGYFVGQTMRKSLGRADPKALSTLLRGRLDK
ncbi:MAG: Asp-tRNA(Asn)/Glu-tRNA(Gln) amidotransferase subunit GatB [Gemmatimonadetes bacterium]|nr:Asp-tRNA(Asn)/Glu-tRNA(Gln) amidotransferase subunit GatB [Gemmatimonadota bacterium]